MTLNIVLNLPFDYKETYTTRQPVATFCHNLSNLGILALLETWKLGSWTTILLTFSITIPNLVWFSRIFSLDFCCQLRTAVVGWQPLVKLYGNVTHVSVKCVLKLSCCFRRVLFIIKLTQDALKELVEIKFL